ncbi:MAG: NifB/NifX family molybdenum-iron cluster-binding protein [Candidatus Thermoplasmatota archaeon]
MKVAVASDDEKHISSHFDRASGFMVLEIVNNKIIRREYRRNTGVKKEECGSCDHDAMIKTIDDCDIVISHGMGNRIYMDLVKNNIKPVITDEILVEEAVDRFIKNKLENRLDRLH